MASWVSKDRLDGDGDETDATGDLNLKNHTPGPTFPASREEGLRYRGIPGEQCHCKVRNIIP